MSNLHGEFLSIHKIKPGLAWCTKGAKNAKKTPKAIWFFFGFLCDLCEKISLST